MKINYSRCWEDTRILQEALLVNPKDDVLSIASGGDNSLALLANNPKTLTLVDSNIAQLFLTELKLIAIQELEHTEAIKFLGYRHSITRLSTYRKIRSKLRPEVQEFWDKNKKLILKGIVHQGKFERYLGAFRRYLLPLINSPMRRLELLKEKSQEEQIQFYTQKWTNWRWNLLFKLFFGESTMKKHGRADGMFKENSVTDVCAHYKTKTQDALQSTSAFNNNYLEFIFIRKYHKTLPDYLQQEQVERIKKSTSEILQIEGTLTELLQKLQSDSFSKFNLSDVFEPLSLSESHQLFSEIVRTARKDAMLIFWNNLVDRDVPAELYTNFERQEKLEQRLKQTDRIFFYNCFRIYKIIK